MSWRAKQVLRALSRRFSRGWTLTTHRLRRKPVRWMATSGAAAFIGMTPASCQPGSHQPAVAPLVSYQNSGTMVRLQAVAAVDDSVAWASGLHGVYIRTIDGGVTWIPAAVHGADTLQFRDIAAFDSRTAYLLAAGYGSLSRIYKTTDGGATWSLQFTNSDPRAFFDCMGFWDPSNGLAFSDAVSGKFIIIRTTDGENWERIPPDVVPDATLGEGSFAASGMCLVTQGDSTAWFGTGGTDSARVFKTTNRGGSWSVVATPVVSGSSAGIAALSFYDRLNGLAAGGDIGNADSYSDNTAQTSDGGLSWTLAGRPTFPGAIYGLASIVSAATPILLAAGPGGLDYSVDRGLTWIALDTLEYWSIDIATPMAGWAVGPAGRIAKILLRP